MRYNAEVRKARVLCQGINVGVKHPEAACVSDSTCLVYTRIMGINPGNDTDSSG